MENNCLVMKLKSVVQNNSLNKIGEIRLSLNAISSRAGFQIYETNNVGKLSIIGQGHFYDEQNNDLGQSIERSMWNNAYYINNTASGDILCIENKYTLSFIMFRDMTELFVSKQKFDTGYLESITVFQPNRNKLSIDLNKLSLYAKNLNNIKVAANEYATGSIEQIVENLISQGRNSGSLVVYGYRCPIEFHDEQFFMTQQTDATMTITFSGSTAEVTYNGNTIATYNGSTWTYNS